MVEEASTLVLGTLGIAVILVAYTPVWNLATGPFVVLMEQVGHVVATLLAGRWVSQVRIERGSRSGRPYGSTQPTGEQDPGRPPRIAFALAGYSGPPIAGLILARGVNRGWEAATMLAVLLVIVGVLVFFHVALRTFVVIVVTALVLALFLWRAGPTAQQGAVVAIAWILLIGGLRRSAYLIDNTETRTDATALQQRTGIPEDVWIAWFVFVAFASLVVGARWLLASG